MLREVINYMRVSDVIQHALELLKIGNTSSGEKSGKYSCRVKDSRVNI